MRFDYVHTTKEFYYKLLFEAALSRILVGFPTTSGRFRFARWTEFIYGGTHPTDGNSPENFSLAKSSWRTRQTQFAAFIDSSGWNDSGWIITVAARERERERERERLFIWRDLFWACFLRSTNLAGKSLPESGRSLVSTNENYQKIVKLKSVFI